MENRKWKRNGCAGPIRWGAFLGAFLWLCLSCLIFYFRLPSRAQNAKKEQVDMLGGAARCRSFTLNDGRPPPHRGTVRCGKRDTIGGSKKIVANIEAKYPHLQTVNAGRKAYSFSLVFHHQRAHSRDR